MTSSRELVCRVLTSLWMDSIRQHRYTVQLFRRPAFLSPPPSWCDPTPAVFPPEPFLDRLLERRITLSAGSRKARVLHQEHRDQPALRIDPHVRGIGTAVAEGAPVNRPTQAIALWREVAGLLARHLRHRGW